MQIGCTQCNSVFKSLIITPDLAWKDIFEKLMTHTVKEHPEFYRQVNQDTTIASATVVTYVLVSRLAKTTEGNKWLEDHMSKMQDAVMGIVGFEPTSENGEEEEEEEEEDTGDDKEDTKEIEAPVFEEADKIK